MDRIFPINLKARKSPVAAIEGPQRTRIALIQANLVSDKMLQEKIQQRAAKLREEGLGPDDLETERAESLVNSATKLAGLKGASRLSKEIGSDQKSHGRNNRSCK